MLVSSFVFLETFELGTVSWFPYLAPNRCQIDNELLKKNENDDMNTKLLQIILRLVTYEFWHLKGERIIFSKLFSSARH